MNSTSYTILFQRPLLRFFFKDVDGLIVVVDSSETEEYRVDIVRDEVARVTQMDEMKGKPLLMVANKQDLPTAAKLTDLVNTYNLNDIRDTPWCKYSTAPLQPN